MGEQILEKLDFDPYETLDLSEECSSVDDIKKAYRKKALQWHPDKNPDRREQAQKMFLQVSKASEILLDPAAKAALDRVRKAKREHKQRVQRLDAKRKKLKEDLEARETQSQVEKEDESKATEKFEQEIERLRKQGSDILKSMREEVERQIREEQAAAAAAAASVSPMDVHNRLKVSWQSDDISFDNGSLTERFKNYGSVVAVVIGAEKKKTKRRTALVELKTFEEAETALISENSIPSNDLTVTWLVPPPAPGGPGRSSPSVTAASSIDPKPASPTIRTDSTNLSNERDFESVILTRMKQAEERKRLIEQMKQEEENDE